MDTNKFFQYARGGVLSSACFGLLLSIAQAESLSLEQALQRAEAANFGLDALREQQLGAYERIGVASARVRRARRMCVPGPRRAAPATDTRRQPALRPGPRR